MADLGTQLWQAEDTKTAAIRLMTLQYTIACDSKAKCSLGATVGVECRDRIGHPIWRKDFCGDHAQPLIAKAKALGIDVFWVGRKRVTHGCLPLDELVVKNTQ